MARSLAARRHGSHHVEQDRDFIIEAAKGREGRLIVQHPPNVLRRSLRLGPQDGIVAHGQLKPGGVRPHMAGRTHG
jgi:hypothetical protein